MRINIRRQSLFLFGWLLLATSIAVQAQLTYLVTNGTVTITGYNGIFGYPTVPSTINGLPVTSIGDYALTGGSITRFTVPNTVTNIGVGAFAYCSRLTNIMVAPLNSAFSSVDGVLFNQSQTTLVQYPGGKVGGYTIPNTVTSIGAASFNGCTMLTNIIIPDSVTSIVTNAFADCGVLTYIMVAPFNSAFSSVDGVLSNQDQTTLVQYPGGKAGSYSIPNSVTSIGSWAFEDCYGLGNITLGSGVISIGDNSFAGCISLTSVTIPSGLTSIGTLAFYGCGLTNLTLGSGVISSGTKPSKTARA